MTAGCDGLDKSELWVMNLLESPNAGRHIYYCGNRNEWKHIMTVSYENATSLKTRHFTVSQELIFQPPGRVISQKEPYEKIWDQSIWAYKSNIGEIKQ